MRTRDLCEAIDAVSKVYCRHTVEVIGRNQRIDVRLEVQRPTFQPIVELAYNVPVSIDAGHFSGLFLMMHCARGSAFATHEGCSAEWRQGQTMPFSAECQTRLWFDSAFVQNGVRLDLDKLNALCERWLGRPLDEPLRFGLQPFSKELETAWQGALAYLRSHDGNSLTFSPVGKSAFDEFLLSLLLQHHPHNYSDEMSGFVPVLMPGLVRKAERFMVDNAENPITVSDVASYLGVSMRSLQTGFRKWRNATPSGFLRQVRLQRVRDALLRADDESNVTTVALRFGFAHLGRFSAYYRSTFGEAPSVTYRRGRSLARRM